MEALTGRAIERWDELLEESGGLREQIPELESKLVDRGMEADGRPLCTVLRPHLIAERDLAHQQRLSAAAISAIRRVREALLLDRELDLRHLSAFREWIGELAELEPSAAADGALLRIDASLARTELHFLELNADAPHGIGHHDAILDFFTELEPYRRFANEFEVRPLRLEERMHETLLESWADFGGSGAPRIAVVTRTNDPVRVSSLEIDLEQYHRNGLDARLCDVTELEFSGGRLRHEGSEIDLVHRVLTTAEAVAHGDEMSALLAAAKAGAVCLVNPFRTELLGHKAIFALLTDPDYDFGFTSGEHEAIRRHIPWTRPVTDERTTGIHGEDVELAEHLVDERARLVLKPTHDFGGHGVRLGWRESAEEWERSVSKALDSDYIAQRRISLHREDYPTMEDDGHRGFYEDTDPYLFRGAAAGMLTRLSPEEITNVHAEGSVVASFAVGDTA